MINKILLKKVTRSKLDVLIKKYASDAQVLDVGGGELAPYKKYFPNLVCLDIQDGDAVDIVADAHNMPIGDNSFDMVLCTSVLGDCWEPNQVVKEMSRIVKPGGKIILNVPFLYPINDAPYDYWRFTPFTLRKLFKDNFSEVEIVPVLRQMETIALIFQRMAYFSKGSKIKRGIFALIARIIDMMKLDNFIEQSGYTSFAKKEEQVVDGFVSAMYFAVFEKK